MSKIICEICGTSYPDTAKECPICGFPHSTVDVDLDELQVENEEYQAPASAEKVKGGRFSNKNVKKRHHEEQEPDAVRHERRPRREPAYDDYDDGGDRGNGSKMKIVVAVLAVLVILVGLYIGFRFWRGAKAYDNPKAPTVTTAPTTLPTETEAPTTEAATLPAGVPCTDMVISNESVEMHVDGHGWLLDVQVTPEDTTEPILFASDNPAVVEVSSSGRLTPVAPGTARITITCGEVTKVCIVTVLAEGETGTEATEAPTEATEAPTEETESSNKQGLRLDRTDVTLFEKDESFTFGLTYNGSAVSRSQVEWRSSDDSVATVENGKVTAVGRGTATITATYNGSKQTCVVRCRIKDDAKPEKPDSQYSDSNWKMSDSVGDVTLGVGESFTLKLTNDAGETANVSWSSSNSGVVSISGNTITGEKSGITHVTASIDGKSFDCIVRVR